MTPELLSWFSLVLWIPFTSAILKTGRTKNAQFIPEKGMVLTNSLLEVHYVTSPIECSFFCTANSRCKSTNYKPGGSTDRKTCELNNSTRKTKSASYKPNSEFIHYYDKEETYKSCLDYLRGGVQENGIYTITDTTGSSFRVFCDLNSEARSAWTLIMSQALKNSAKDEFCKIDLTKNAPVQQNTPNWEAYRLSLTRMQHLSQQSTHLRMTTGFTKHGVDSRDYLRAKISNVDILTFIGLGVCKEVEYINVRGITGYDVKASFWQTVNQFIFHVDVYHNGCAFNAKVGAVASENGFGFYCEPGKINPNFRGTANNESTTEYWFGGYL